MKKNSNPMIQMSDAFIIKLNTLLTTIFLYGVLPMLLFLMSQESVAGNSGDDWNLNPTIDLIKKALGGTVGTLLGFVAFIIALISAVSNFNLKIFAIFVGISLAILGGANVIDGIFSAVI